MARRVVHGNKAQILGIFSPLKLMSHLCSAIDRPVSQDGSQSVRYGTNFYRVTEFLLEQGIMTRISRADVPKPKTKRISAPHPSSVPIPNTITPDRQPMVPVLPVQGSSGYPPYPELWPDKTSRAQQLPHVENPPAQRPSSHQTPLEGAPVTPSPSPSPKTGKSGVNRLVRA